MFPLLTCRQRESTAMIQGPPSAYAQGSPPAPGNIIKIDCRGLEVVDFKADVSENVLDSKGPFLRVDRVTGWQMD